MIAQNVAQLRARIAAAAEAAGRKPEEIQLCAATKMNDASRVREAVAAGVDCCGENRVQELCEKLPLGAYTGKPVHFIGHLQTNKVNKVVGKVDLIQSVDREELLACIDRAAQRMGVCQHILLEINIGDEPQKGGFSPEQARLLAAEMDRYPGVRLDGLMAIPPVSKKKGDNCKYFAKMHQLFIDIGEKKYDNVSMICLSMGMSDDFEDAIAEGTTMVRVGTAIFGARAYPAAVAGESKAR